MISDLNLSVSPEVAADRKLLEKEILRKVGFSAGSLNEWRITRRSIDARKRPVRINLQVKVALGDDKHIPLDYQPIDYRPVGDNAQQVVIVGAGPAGLFAALRTIELGLKPIVVERGKDVDSRRLDIASLNRNGEVNPDSNYCFGEGGAGTFSDGKLFTRSKKRGNVGRILSILVQHGAEKEILIDSHPHIGSDRLPKIMKSIRERVIANGGEVRFCSKVVGLMTEPTSEGGLKATGVELADGTRLSGPVIMATGHSARDVYRLLDTAGVRLEPKGLAIGVRLEHPQKTIDSIQYHSPQGRGPWLPPAEYNFVARVGERGVYSFCMCPGGVVVPAVSEPGECVVNGMSASSRSSIWSNSGMVVELHPGDIEGYDAEGPFEMMALQEDLEKRFYEATGNSLQAPAQRMKDFVEGKLSRTIPPSSYIPGTVSVRVDSLFPDFIARRLKEGFVSFGRKARGFLTNEATVIGLESRTSSPIRIPRDAETLCHTEVSGLYPAGEGAGYAGGIVSAAIDGERCAESVVNAMKLKKNS